ncbi:Hypothetical protein CINCED_3A008339 [Cinara cedri]|uniref:Uncharacterized protein n=1 Tax=Cinara cedri TaxID=506608 RepID=A0A5E4MC56_9HEMI|nr:Hypothetical protein CINCED_3A008339 [Cinara cedri]
MSEINERIDNAEHEYLMKKKKNTSVQKQKGLLNEKFLGMIEEINKDFKQIKKLFMNGTNNNSSCDFNTHKMNHINSMSAGEDIADNNILVNRNTNDQNKYYDFQNSAKFEYNDEFDRYINKSQRTACSQDNIEFWCTNNQIMYNGQSLQHETIEGLYQIKIEDLNAAGVINTVHFFSWENQSICQCGMTYNSN